MDEINRLVREKDQAYKERNQLVAALSKLFETCSWLGRHVDEPGEDWDNEWRWIVFIHPEHCGQMSWHIHDSDLPMFEHLFREPERVVQPIYNAMGVKTGLYESDRGAPWDGHSSEEKYQRLLNIGSYANGCPVCGDSR